MLSSKTLSKTTKIFLAVSLWSLVMNVGLIWTAYNKRYPILISGINFKDTNLFWQLILIIAIVSVVTFLFSTLFLFLTLHAIKKEDEPATPTPIFLRIYKTILIIPIYPLYSAFLVFNPFSLRDQLKKTSVKKIALDRFLRLVFTVLVACPVWFSFYFVLCAFTLQGLNYFEEPIPVSGTGSMYPTFPKGTSKTPQELSQETVTAPGMTPYPNGLFIFGQRFFDYHIGRGDIVVFINEKTKEITRKMYGEESGYVKRVIAIPGDKLEIRGGLVYLNDSVLNEPYIARARSTFGGEFLPDCQSIIIPEGKLFVMGDNRKGSGDSRHELGLVDYQDIHHVLPSAKQKGEFDKNWRNTANDQTDAAKIKLDTEEYLTLLNQKRQEAGLKPLKNNSKLIISAKLRAENILEFDDLSWEATKSGFTTKKAMDQASYFNITYGEAPSNGYYDAQELLDNFFEFADTKEFLLNKDYQEIGVAQVEGEINGCPGQVIVQHFGGYIPPNYKKDLIQSWSEMLNNLKSIQPGWSSLKTNKDFYEKNKERVDRINEIIDMRIANITKVVNKMNANQWLSDTELDYTKHDEQLFNEQQSIAKIINGQ